MSDSDRLTILFNLYVQNKLDRSEFDEFFSLLNKTHTEYQLNNEFYDLWNDLEVGKNIQEPDWNKLYQNVTNGYKQSATVVKINRVKNFRYLAVAAAVFIGVFFVLLFSVSHRSNQNVNIITYTVPYHSTKTVKLSDGSLVVLNAGTTIKYPAVFKGKTREVSIDGEGYFKVVHLIDKPFIVHSGKLQTQVLGTAFNVKSYSKASNLKVTVVSGKVAVKEVSTGKQFMLVANQQAILNGRVGFFKKSVIADAENTIAWQDGKLIFEDASLDEIATQLSLEYGIKATLSNSQLKKCRISAVFYNKPLKEILAVITRLTGSSYTLNNKSVVIFGKGCSSNL